MAPNVDFKTGDTVNFYGHNAIVSEAHYYSDTVTIIVNGKEYSVNKNDLFGMNNHKNDYYFDERIENYNEQIENNKETIKEQNTLWALAKAKIKECINQMSSILRSAGVTNGSQISDEKQKAQYDAFRDSRIDARSKQIRATAEIMNAANNTATLALNKMNVTHQKALNKIV